MKLGLLLLLIAGSALAQYRDNQPQVMERLVPAPANDPGPDIQTAFRSAYKSAGRPRMALFWNVVLTDQTAEVVTQSSRIRGEKTHTVSRLEEQTNGEAGNSRIVDGQERRSIDLKIDRTSTTSDSAKRGTPLTERDAWMLETAFTKAMIEVDARLIDRNVIMRVTAAQLEPGKPGDPRVLETKALLGKADLVLEILMTRDADSPLGWGFRCTLREISTGHLKGAFYSRAVPFVPVPAAQYQASSNGFVRVESTPPLITVEQVGRQLAFDAMEQFSALSKTGRSQ